MFLSYPEMGKRWKGQGNARKYTEILCCPLLLAWSDVKGISPVAPRGKHTAATNGSQGESQDVLDERENWDQEGASGFAVLGRKSTARGRGGHLSIGSKGRTGQVPVAGTALGDSPCQVLSPEKCRQNFQAGSSTTPQQDCHRPRGAQWFQSSAKAAVPHQTQELDDPCGSLLTGIFCDSTRGKLKSNYKYLEMTVKSDPSGLGFFNIHQHREGH